MLSVAEIGRKLGRILLKGKKGEDADGL